MDKYIDELIKLSKKAYSKNEVPVSAIIVYENKIIAKSYNKRFKNNDVLNHAEISAIKKASKYIKDWRLNGCDLYVTLKPCEMCEEIIKASRIDNVYYLIDKEETKKKYDKTQILKIGNIYTEDSEYIKKIMSDFFNKKRDK